MKLISDKPYHPWRERTIIGLIMVVLAFIGLIITEVHNEGGWQYWRYIVYVYALLALWLSWYIHRKLDSVSPIKLWHELLHWGALIFSVYLLSLFVDAGILGRFPASLVALTLLSLTVFLAGVYIEITFLPVGILLGLLTALVALFVEYFFFFIFPLVIIAVALVYWLARRHPKHLL